MTAVFTCVSCALRMSVLYDSGVHLCQLLYTIRVTLKHVIFVDIQCHIHVKLGVVRRLSQLLNYTTQTDMQI